jgi:hypothetical protein
MTAIGPGSKVKCIKRSGWIHTETERPTTGPEFGSVWTVWAIPKVGMLLLAEWVECDDEPGVSIFDERNFVPLDPDIEVFRALLTDIRDPDAERRKEIVRMDV